MGIGDAESKQTLGTGVSRIALRREFLSSSFSFCKMTRHDGNYYQNERLLRIRQLDLWALSGDAMCASHQSIAGHSKLATKGITSSNPPSWGSQGRIKLNKYGSTVGASMVTVQSSN